MPTFGSIPIRRAATAALAGAMLITLLPAASMASVSDAPAVVKAAEWRVLSEMNHFRARRGLEPLRMANGVRLVARDRSRSMKRQHYFSHTSPSGVDAAAMMNRRGISHGVWGENIGAIRNMRVDTAVEWMVDAWARSPGHRYNMLYPGFNYVGIGVARAGDYLGAELFFTVVFVNQRDHTAPKAALAHSGSGISVASEAAKRRVTVRWWGGDRRLATRTAGLKGFTVQYRPVDGKWRTIRKNTRQRSATVALPDGTHWFRVRAVDRRGNRSAWQRPLRVTVH